MSLTVYQRKRNFARTPEPRPATVGDQEGRAFVVQKHAAGRLHYDFRLEIAGVLKSWAVPKGPSLDPRVKRLAVAVEDHPLEYGRFEGTIPPGEYGGGTVMLWDRGTWEPLGDAQADFQQGKLKFNLHGQKLRGGWMLVRTGGARGQRDENAWLLIKERDDEVRDAEEFDVLSEEPRSVLSGLDLEGIAAGKTGKPPAIKKSGPAKAKQRGATKASATAQNTPARKFPAKTPSANGAPPSAAPRKAIEFAGVRLTSPDKLLYPEEGISKQRLAEYYAQIAEWILPHLENRPLVLVRCPDGRHQDCFYQKHAMRGAPPALLQMPIQESSKTDNFVYLNDLAGLVSLVQIGTLEIHAWGARTDDIERPDRLVFDLDPDEAVPWARVVAAANQVRAFLRELGLESFLKTTGGKGLHLVVPVRRRHDWDEVKEFCRQVAAGIVRADPRSYTDKMSKAARRGKIYLDYLRNSRGATSVAAYSTRARSAAPVSAPLAWEELSAEVRSDHYTIANLPGRLKRLRRDPWAELGTSRQSISVSAKKTLRTLVG